MGDLLPHNILLPASEHPLRGGGKDVFFAEFGLSGDYSGDLGSTPGVTGMTPRYAAPEVAVGSPRNTSADIWSLVCVFLGMAVILNGHTVEWMREF